MKKIFLIAIVLFVGAKAWSQQPFELGATKHDSIYYNETATWITGVSQDTTLADADSNKLVTEYAVKKAIDNMGVTAGTQDSINAHTDTLQALRVDVNINTNSIASKQDSIDAHTDTLQAIRVDVNTNTNSIASHADSITAHSDSIAELRLDINTVTGTVDALLDSIAAHTDTLQAMRVDINDLINNGVGTVVLDTFTTIAPLITCTRDTLRASDSTEYELIIFEGDEFDGRNLVDLECKSMRSAGTAVVTLDAYRLRGSTEVKMTSVGASFTASAIINTSYDDVRAGDKIRFKWTIGAGTAPIGLKAKPKFQ